MKYQYSFGGNGRISVDPDNIPPLIAAWATKHGLQPGTPYKLIDPAHSIGLANQHRDLMSAGTRDDWDEFLGKWSDSPGQRLVEFKAETKEGIDEAQWIFTMYAPTIWASTRGKAQKIYNKMFKRLHEAGYPEDLIMLSIPFEWKGDE